jgi:hypothetical protein
MIFPVGRSGLVRKEVAGNETNDLAGFESDDKDTIGGSQGKQQGPDDKDMGGADQQ